MIHDDLKVIGIQDVASVKERLFDLNEKFRKLSSIIDASQNIVIALQERIIDEHKEIRNKKHAMFKVEREIYLLEEALKKAKSNDRN